MLIYEVEQRGAIVRRVIKYMGRLKQGRLKQDKHYFNKVCTEFFCPRLPVSADEECLFLPRHLSHESFISCFQEEKRGGQSNLLVPAVFKCF